MLPVVTTHIYDGMVLIRQLKTASLQTFADVSKSLLDQIIVNTTVYFVTDQYRAGSIKSFERARRAEEGSIRIRITRRETPLPKQWTKYLKDGSNKTELVEFLLTDWSHKTRHAKEIKGKTLFVNAGSSFYKLTCADNEVNYFGFGFELFVLI